MVKTPVKFQWNRYKSVGGVAHTKNLLSIHFDSKERGGQNYGKSDQILSEDYIQTICISSDHDL